MIYFFTQSCNRRPKFLVQIPGLFGIVLFASYEADLTTKMTIQEQALPLRSFEDIYNSEDNKVVVRAQTAQWTMLKKAKEGSAMRRIFEGMGEEQIVVDPNCKNPCIEAMLRVREKVYTKISKIFTSLISVKGCLER